MNWPHVGKKIQKPYLDSLINRSHLSLSSCNFKRPNLTAGETLSRNSAVQNVDSLKTLNIVRPELALFIYCGIS